MTSRLYDRLSLRTLRLILAIERHGSLSQAAEEVHIAVSAASRRIRFLEDSLGFQLIDRTSRGISLTAAGRAVADHARRIGADIDRLEDALRDIGEGALEPLRLSVAGPALCDDLPDRLAGFLTAYPRVRLSLEEHTSDTVADDVLQGRAELGVLLGQDSHPGLSLTLYRPDRLGIVVRPDHPLAAHREVTIDQVLDQDWILPPGATIGRILTRGSAMELSGRIRVLGVAAVCRMIAAGLGITALPLASTASEIAGRGLVGVKLAEDWAECDLHLAVARQASPSPALKALIATLASPAGEAALPKR